jgi:hypothetical protein
MVVARAEVVAEVERGSLRTCEVPFVIMVPLLVSSEAFGDYLLRLWDESARHVFCFQS